MTVEETIEKGTGAIYHEIGHFFAYCLANRKKNYFLGDISEFAIGTIKSCVGVRESLYHFERTEEGIEKIRNNTKNIERTVAWFIEVISGCTFQIIVENRNFDDCFGLEHFKLGQIDCSNIVAIKPFSSFKIEMPKIFNLQKEYENILKFHNIIGRVEIIIDEIKDDLRKTKNCQVFYDDDKIVHYQNLLNEIITDELYSEYEEKIKNFC